MHKTSMHKLFQNIDTWVFDLDNTLYPASCNLFDQIETRMTAYVADVLNIAHAEADRLRLHYYHTYGTTLTGLIREHNIDPEPYLIAVHDIDFTPLPAMPKLRELIPVMDGRKIVFTNGSRPYALNVLKHLQLNDIFDSVYGVEHADYISKPHKEAFEKVFARDGLYPERAVMFEDDPRNLLAPKAMGLRTVLISDSDEHPVQADIVTPSLTDFLSRLLEDDLQIAHKTPV